MREQALLLGRDLSLVGILTEDGDNYHTKRKMPVGVLLLNAGLYHHVGPSCIYVKFARTLAGMGFIALRFDFSGVGDSGPRMDKLGKADSIVDEIRQAMNHLEHYKGIKQFICIGICDGAAAACQIAAIDGRVKKAVIINPPIAESPEGEGMVISNYYRKNAMRNPKSWIKFFSFQADYKKLFKAVCKEVRNKVVPNRFYKSKSSETVTLINQLLRLLRTRGVRMFMVFSESEIGEKYFREVVREEFQKLLDSGLLTTETLFRTDHSITPLNSQEKLLSLVSAWVSDNDEALLDCQVV